MNWIYDIAKCLFTYDRKNDSKNLYSINLKTVVKCKKHEVYVNVVSDDEDSDSDSDA